MDSEVEAGSLKTAPPVVFSSLDKGVKRRGRSRWRYGVISWTGLVPFLLFCLLFELLPGVVIITGSFTDSTTNALTLDNYQRMLSQSGNIHAFQNSISLSLVTGLLGAFFGFFVTYGIFRLQNSRLRDLLIGFSSISANFAGVPLAYAFISTLGVTGFVTVFLHNALHIDLYNLGFNLYTFWGLVLVYIYFQFPLMVLIMMPALNALRPEWREAATNLGASATTYWLRVALPILMPSLVAATLLLFANAFGAYATAVALAQGSINIVPVLIGFVVNGNVGLDTGLGNALAIGMMLVLLLVIGIYTAMMRRASRWQGR